MGHATLASLLLASPRNVLHKLSPADEAEEYRTSISSSSSNSAFSFLSENEHGDDDDDTVSSCDDYSWDGPPPALPAQPDGHKSEWFSRCLATLSGHVGAVSSIATLNNATVVSASRSTDIVAWAQPDMRQCGPPFGHGHGALKALLPVSGDRLVSAHQDRRIRVWRLCRSKSNDASSWTRAFKLVATLPTASDYVGTRLRRNAHVTVRRHHRKLWIEHADAVTCLAGSGGVVYSGSWDRSFKVWRATDFKCVESVRAHDDAINALLVGPTGVLYTASADSTVKAWSLTGGSPTHRLLATMRGHYASVNALALSADGNVVYSGGSDGAIVAWGSDNCALQFRAVAEMRAQRDGDSASPAVLCLASVGELLCSGGSDRTVRIWARSDDCASFFRLRNVAVLRGHSGPVKCLAGIADVAGGSFVYSGSVDGCVRVWWVAQRRA